MTLISIHGFLSLRTRPGLPQGSNTESLRRVDGYEIKQHEDIGFIISQKKIGDQIILDFETTEGEMLANVKLIPFFSTVPYPLIYLLIGLGCIAISTFIYIFKSEDEKVRIFFWLSLTFSSTLIISGGFHCLRKDWLSYFPGLLFNLSYPLASALLFHFSLSFLQPNFRRAKQGAYGLAIFLSGALIFSFLGALLTSSLDVFRIYQSIYRVFRVYAMAMMVLSIFTLIVAYRRAQLEEKRDQIKWIFLGIFLSLGPYTLLYHGPRIIRVEPILSEEIATLFFVFAPLGFILSIFRFRLLDVELVINRSLVYSLLTIFTVSVYLLSVQVLYGLLIRYFRVRETFLSLAGVLAAAVAFNPARKKIQEYVDRVFFRMSYDYRKCVSSFIEEAQNIAGKDELVNFFLLKIQSAVPVEWFGLFVFSVSPTRYEPYLLAGETFDLSPQDSFLLKTDKVFASSKSVTTALGLDFTREKFLEGRRVEMVLPLDFKSTSLAGFLTLGRKKSEEKFTRDDLELLMTMAREFALNLERIKLQEEVIYERASKDKLEELNRLKTEFISTVSHELRTPMSSIQGLSEILGTGKIRDKARSEELLGLIAAESARLSRLLHNILDFGRIEQDAKKFHFQKTEIRPLIEEVAELFRSTLENQSFAFKMTYPETPVFLEVDRDSIKQVLINLFDNAIKYSREKKEITVELEEGPGRVVIRISDRGIGIPREEQEKIFEKFYRASEGVRVNPRGVGLGLKIVKYILEGHGGEVKVMSEPGRGSTFRLVFPR